MPLHLDDAAIEDLVDRADAERAVWAAFEAWGHGVAATTQRVRAAGAGAMASAMAAVVPPHSGGKLYATHDGRFTFVNVLFDGDGTLLATLDGDAITRLRTPAASSLAVRHLAVADATTATVVGAGLQSWSHVEMLAAHLPHLTDLRLCGRDGGDDSGTDGHGGLADLAARAGAAGLPVSVHRDVAGAVDGAQVVVTLTSARQPLFPAEVVGDDTLICAVGATKADRAEIGPDVVERCVTVVCDDVTGSRTECGDLVQAAAGGRFDWSRAIELHAVAAGRVAVERAGAGPVLFETQGVAIQDVAVAGLAWQRWCERSASHADPDPDMSHPNLHSGAQP